METWTMSGWETNGCPAWVCPSTVLISWSRWWMLACLTTWPRRNWGASWRWWTVSTGPSSVSTQFTPSSFQHRCWNMTFSSTQSESTLRYHVFEALELWQEGAGEEEGWKSTPEPRWVTQTRLHTQFVWFKVAITVFSASRCNGVVQWASYVLGAVYRPERVCRQPVRKRSTRCTLGIRWHLWLHRFGPSPSDTQSEHAGTPPYP